MLISAGLQSHIQGAKEAIQDDVNAVKQHPLASMGIMGATVMAGRRFPRVAALANVALATRYAVDAVSNEYLASNTTDEKVRQSYFSKAGKHLFNLGLSGIGLPSAVKDLRPNLAPGSKVEASWQLLAGLTDDSLLALNLIPGQSTTTPSQSLIDNENSPTFKPFSNGTSTEVGRQLMATA